MIIKYIYNTNEKNLINKFSLHRPDEAGYNITYRRLIADDGKMLTKDDINYYSVIDINKNEIESWKEVLPPPVEDISQEEGDAIKDGNT